MPDDADGLTALRQRVAERQARSLPRLIVEELEQMIINGALRAGERINESAIAQRLGVSRGAVREACRQLERGGLVELRTNRGMFVRQISITDAAHLYDIRASLFALAGRHAAARITDEDAQRLRAQVESLAAATELDDYYPRNVELHRHIVALSGNPRLVQLYDEVSNELHLFRRHGLEPPDARRTSNTQHRRIVEHLIAGHADEAARLMEAHILAGQQRMLTEHRDAIGEVPG